MVSTRTTKPASSNSAVASSTDFPTTSGTSAVSTGEGTGGCVVIVTGDGEPASASVSLISELPTPAAIRMTTTTIAQNHQRFQKGVELRGASGGGGGGGGSWSIAEELCAAFAEPSTRGTRSAPALYVETNHPVPG